MTVFECVGCGEPIPREIVENPGKLEPGDSLVKVYDGRPDRGNADVDYYHSTRCFENHG